MKELHEDDGGDNTEPLEDFLGPSIEEVGGVSCNLRTYLERREQAHGAVRHIRAYSLGLM